MLSLIVSRKYSKHSKFIQHSKYSKFACMIMMRIAFCWRKSRALARSLRRTRSREYVVLSKMVHRRRSCSESHVLCNTQKEKLFLNKEWGKSILQIVPKKGKLLSCTSHHKMATQWDLSLSQKIHSTEKTICKIGCCSMSGADKTWKLLGLLW